MVKIMLLVLLLLPNAVLGEWSMEQSRDGHWLSTRSSEQHQLIVAAGETTQLLLILAIPGRTIEVPPDIVMTIDRGEGVHAKLILLEQGDFGIALRIELRDLDEMKFIRRMIAGLTLKVSFGKPAAGKESLDFSLLGFTAAYNDLLIANDIGKLDLDWLRENHMEKEFACYHRAGWTVQALNARLQNKTPRQALSMLSPSGIKDVDSMLPGIVERTYKISASKLPRLPVVAKYNIYKQCIEAWGK